MFGIIVYFGTRVNSNIINPDGNRHSPKLATCNIPPSMFYYFPPPSNIEICFRWLSGMEGESLCLIPYGSTHMLTDIENAIRLGSSVLLEVPPSLPC